MCCRRETSSLAPPDASRLFDEELARLRSNIRRGAARLAEQRQAREAASREHERLVAQHQAAQAGCFQHFT